LAVGVLEEAIAEDAFVRVIDLFVERLGDLSRLGFTLPPSRPKEKGGAPAYAHSILLKCYLYGYYYGIRSSRRLARQCRINIEMMWLMEGLRPEYHTICDFRKNYPEALRRVFTAFNEFLNQQDLFGKETIAIDGVKIRAQNSKKNNYNEDKIKRHKEYNDKKTKEYLKEIEELDQQEASRKDSKKKKEERKAKIQKALAALEKSKDKYDKLGAQLAEAQKTGQTQISTTDPDSRALPEHMNIVSVGYNIQTGVDDKHCLIAHFEVTNCADVHALGQMACDTATALGTTIEHSMNVLADAGYQCGEELDFCQDNNLITYVAPVQGNTTREEGFRKEDFQYNPASDSYTCPAGQTLSTNGQWYHRKNKYGRVISSFQRYIAVKEICQACSLAAQCLANCDPKRCKKGRSIERSQYEQAVEANRTRVEQNKDLYRRRQAIVEHPFGTVKRAWGYTYTLLKRIRKVSGEFSLIYTAYNMRRSVSILGFKGLMDALKSWELNLEWVEKTQIFVFSLLAALWRCLPMKKQGLRYSDAGIGIGTPLYIRLCAVG
jgi:transposase